MPTQDVFFANFFSSSNTLSPIPSLLNFSFIIKSSIYKFFPFPVEYLKYVIAIPIILFSDSATNKSYTG